MKMRSMEPILTYASLLALCYFVTLINAENYSENVTRNKRSLGEFRPRNLVGTLIQQGRGLE